MLQSAFQSFFSVAEKAKLGLLLSLAAGATNSTFDYVFIALLGMGVTDAAWATVLGYCVVSSRWCTSCFPEERACGWCGRTFTTRNCFTPVSTAPRS
ncbi:MAG: hypothetical protein ACLT1A_12120 [Dysosmobacter sp.]